MKNIIRILLQALLSLFSIYACKESSFLDQPPTMQEVVPTTVGDYERLLRHPIFYEAIIPGFGEAASDDYYTTDFIPGTDDLKSIYLWQDGIYEGVQKMQWARPYQVVFYANNVLEGLDRIEDSDTDLLRKLRGEAFFHRAHQFYHLAQIFAPHHQRATASTDLGIPLRLTADVNESITRATVQQTYDRIITDLQEACRLLPQGIESRTVPSKEAAHALLSRVYWTMGDFESAKNHADTSLLYYNVLLDYNDIDRNTTNPFDQFNVEVIYHSTAASVTNILYTPPFMRVSNELYGSYNEDDLRYYLFFQPEAEGVSYRGSYDGSSWALFFGLAVDELYLIRSESAFRIGDRQTAEADLNHLLSHRYNIDSSKPVLASMDDAAFLDYLIAERRRELAFRGLRWIDLRRLNAMGYNITITREYDGEVYTLAPDDARWTFPFPPEVLSFNPSMDQNPG